MITASLTIHKAIIKKITPFIP